MIKIGICDDNETLLKKYSKIIQEVCRQNKLETEIMTFKDGVEVIEATQRNNKLLDILFLDILMVKMNGIETARKLKEIKSKVSIIFLTSSEEYIFESMDINAFAYIMKEQLTKTLLEKIINNAYENIVKERAEVFILKKEERDYYLAYSDICFIKIYGEFFYIHHWNGIIYESADQKIMQVLDKRFFKVHKQYIINLQYIKRLDKDNIVLNDESQNVIPIDKRYSHDLKFQFARYMTEKM